MGIWHLFVMRNHSVFIVRGSLLRWYSVWPLFHTCGETSFIELPWRNKAVILWIFNRCQHGNKLSMCQRKDAPCFLVAYGTLGVLWVSWRRWSSASRRGTSEEGITFVCSWYCARLLSCSTLSILSLSLLCSLSWVAWTMIWALCSTLLFLTGFKVSSDYVAEFVVLHEEGKDIQLEAQVHVKMPSSLIFWNSLYLFHYLFDFLSKSVL